LQKKVYISSTFRDLKDHREKVIDFFQKFPDKFELISMEYYVAEDIPPVDKCIQDVMNCDIYILILANRYGFIPDGTATSVTETEYQTAKKYHKEILAFITDDKSFPADEDGDVEVKKQKLAQLKKTVRAATLTHPEDFISPDGLTVQLSESLMKRLFLDYQIADQRKLCCDRSLQFSEYLKNRTRNKLKVFIIHGNKKELGRNMINRFLFFTLNTGIKDKLPYHLITDFILNDYENSKTNLIVDILVKDLHLNDITETGFDHLISKINEWPYPSVIIVLECSTEFLREEDTDILKKFFQEFNAAYKDTGTKDVYLFVNIKDEQQDENPLKQQINSFLQCNIPGNDFIFCLPRLKRENSQAIEQWISTYLTGDETSIYQLMEKYFTTLVNTKEFTMTEAEINIQNLLKKINSGDKELIEILNL
jgi:hypothetical protein